MLLLILKPYRLAGPLAKVAIDKRLFAGWLFCINTVKMLVFLPWCLLLLHVLFELRHPDIQYIGGLKVKF